MAAETEERLANGLGWFSIGLGLAEVLAPGGLANFIGVRDSSKTRTVLRTYGFREIAAGIGILSQRRPAAWMWGRVAGDLLDLSSMAAGEAQSTGRLIGASAAVVGVTALDLYCAKQLSQKNGQSSGTRVTKTIIVNRPPAEAYAFWRNLSNLPRFMAHVEAVEPRGERRSYWRAKGPAGLTVEWEADITEDQPDSRIAWQTLPGSDVYHSGSVAFERAPGGRGTLVRVEMNYAPPGGAITATVAKLFGADPEMLVKGDLHRFRQILETGEVVHSDSSIHSGMHAAQPPADQEVPRVRTSSGERAPQPQPSLA